MQGSRRKIETRIFILVQQIMKTREKIKKLMYEVSMNGISKGFDDILIAKRLNEVIDRVNELSSPEKKEEVKRYCTPSDMVLLSNPSQFRCKICGKTWRCEDNTPICIGIEKEEPTREFTKEELRQIKEFIAWDSNSKEYTEEIMNSILSKIEKLLK